MRPTIRPEEEYELEERDLTLIIQRLEDDRAIPGADGDVARLYRSYCCLKNKVFRLEREAAEKSAATVAMAGTRGRRGI